MTVLLGLVVTVLTGWIWAFVGFLVRPDRFLSDCNKTFSAATWPEVLISVAWLAVVLVVPIAVDRDEHPAAFVAVLVLCVPAPAFITVAELAQRLTHARMQGTFCW